MEEERVEGEDVEGPQEDEEEGDGKEKEGAGEDQEEEAAQEENGDQKGLGQEGMADFRVRVCNSGLDDQGEEGRLAKKVRSPVRVSSSEIEDHERTHTPFRQWCRHCVMGRGTNDPHQKKKSGSEKEEVEEGTARINMDYFYLSTDDEKASRSPMLVMVDEETGEIC